MLVPPSAAASLDSMVACAAPRPRISRALADRRTRPASSSASSRRTSVANVRAIGPIFTFMLAFQFDSSTSSTSSAPGMQGTTRRTSISSAHAAERSAGTSNELSIRTSSS
jgi:hypothetical protein